MSASFDFAQDKRGFTLIELLVVITVIAVISVVTFLNIGTSREDQTLKSNVSSFVSFLRLAQTNAQGETVCPDVAVVPGLNGSSANFWVELNSAGTVYLRCGGGATQIKTLTFTGVTIPSSGINCVSPNGASNLLSPGAGVNVSFAQLTGAVSFAGSVQCNTAASIVVTLQNSATGNKSTVTVNQGGSINVK